MTVKELRDLLDTFDYRANIVFTSPTVIATHKIFFTIENKRIDVVIDKNEHNLYQQQQIILKLKKTEVENEMQE